MQPYEEAKATANAIALAGLVNCFVTISWGGEYINSFDVEPSVPIKPKPKENAMDIGSITKLALSLLGKRDELLAIVQEALALWSKIQKVMPGLTEQLKGLTGEKPAAAAPKMDIRWLQESLNKLISANLTVDGNYGKATQDAVKQFQQANNLTADGWAGVQTQAAIVDALG